jgi:hypothetical protein
MHRRTAKVFEIVRDYSMHNRAEASPVKLSGASWAAFPICKSACRDEMQMPESDH